MNTTLLYSTDCKLTIYKEREVDIKVYVHPRILNLLDVQTVLQLPTQKKLDALITPYRQVEYMQNSFNTHKEDAPSFFESYESDENAIVNSTILSTDLKAISPLSKRLRKPIGQFHTLHTISEQYNMTSDDDRYIAILPKDFKALLNMNDYLSNFWITAIVNKDAPNYFIDYTKSSKPHTDAFSQFNFTNMDNVEIYQEHLLDTNVIPSVGNSNERVLVSYSALLFLPYLRDYQFFISSGDNNNADELVEVYIDDENIVSSYSYKEGTKSSKSLSLSEGFHTINIIRIYRVGSFSHKQVYGKQSGSTQFNIEVNDLTTKTGIETYSPSSLFQVNDLTNFILYPINYFTKELSILVKKYLPLTILSVPNKKEIQSSYKNNYIYTPDNITTIGGNFDFTNVFNSITYKNSGVITKTDEDKPITISFKYNTAAVFNAISIYDNSETQNKFNYFKLKVFDNTGDYKDSEYLLYNIDYENSFNIKSVRAEFDWLIIDRKDVRYGVQLVFKDSFLSLGVNLSLPVTDTYHIDEIIIGAIKYSNFVVATQSGKFYELYQMDDKRMQEVTTKFDEIVAIPELYKHIELPKDIKDSSDFVIFSLRNYSPVDIEILGTAFDIWNDDKNTNKEHRYLDVHNLWGNKYTFNIYNNWDKTQLYNWNHVAYDVNNDKIIVDKLDTLQYTIKNLTDNDINNGVFIISIPHYDHAWQGTVSGSGVHIVGVNADNQGKYTQYVSNFDDWKSNYIAVQLSISANSEITLDLSTGNFSAVSDITGSIVAKTNYHYMPNKADTSIAVVDANEWPPKSLRTIYTLNDTSATLSDAIQLDRNILNMYTYNIINKTGEAVKTEFLLDMSAFRKMYGTHVPFKLVDATTYEPVDFLYRNSVNNYTQYFNQWDGVEVAVKWNNPLNISQSILEKYNQIFTNYVDLTSSKDIISPKIIENKILLLRYHNGNSSHPNNHNELINNFDYNNLYYKGLVDDINTGNYGDHYCMLFSFILDVKEEGEWYFAVDSDDASEIEIDGNIIASWYGAHGTCNCQSYNGHLHLNKGQHKIIIRQEEETGGDWMRLWFRSPSMSSWKVFSIAELDNKAMCLTYIPNDSEAKTHDFIVNGIDLSTYTIKLTLGNDAIDFSKLNTDATNFKVVSDLLFDLKYKVLSIDTTNEQLELLIQSAKLPSINKDKIFILYGGSQIIKQNDTLTTGDDETYTVNDKGTLKPDTDPHRYEGTKLLVLPGFYETTHKDSYTLPYIDNLQSPSFWYACNPAKSDYSNYQTPMQFYNDENIYFSPDKEGREVEAIELYGDSAFKVNKASKHILQIRYKTNTNTTYNHNDLLNTIYPDQVLFFEYCDSIYLPDVNYAEYYSLFFVTFLEVIEEGDWQFRIAGDDIVELEIDGSVIASGYNGTCCSNRYGSVNLSKGRHKLIVRHKEYSGGDWIKLWFRSPSDSDYRPFTINELKNKANCWYYDIPESYVKSSNFVRTGLPQYTPLHDYTLSFHFFTVRKNKQLLYLSTSSDNDLEILRNNSVLSLFVNNNGFIELHTNNEIRIDETNVVDGLWHHIVLNNVNSDLFLFVDGKCSVPTTTAPSYQAITFGDSLDADSYVGRFDEIRTYNRAVSLAEVYILNKNLKVEFIPPDISIIPTIPANIDYPTSVTTSLIDLKNNSGVPVILHKYRNIDTVVVEDLANIFAPI